MIPEDAESVATERKNVPLPVLEPDCTVKVALAREFHLDASDVGGLQVLLVVLGVSDEDHLALVAVVEQNVFVEELTAAYVFVFVLIFALRARVGLGVLPLVLERRHVGVDVIGALELRLYEFHLPIRVEGFCDFLALFLQIGDLPAILGSEESFDIDFEQVSEVMRVALCEIVANAVDLFDLLLMEEKLSEVVLVIDVVALASMGLYLRVLLLSYP